jgi:hypothetical protein
LNTLKLQTETRKLDEEHILYLIKLKNDTDEFCKIGVTSKSIDERLSHIEGYEIEIVKLIKDDGYNIRALESILKERVLDYNRKYQFKYYTKFNGYTECYNLDFCADIEICFKYLEGKLKRKPSIKRTPNSLKLVNQFNQLDKENKDLIRINKKLTFDKESIIKRNILIHQNNRILTDNNEKIESYYKKEIDVKDESILDLENQLDELVSQVIKLELEIPHKYFSGIIETNEDELYSYIQNETKHYTKIN